MTLTKSLLAAATLSIFSAGAASAVTLEQCTQLGGITSVATSECQLTCEQYAEGFGLGFILRENVPLVCHEAAGIASDGGATLGAVGPSGGTLAAAGGLILLTVLVGDGSSGTTTTSAAVD